MTRMFCLLALTALLAACSAAPAPYSYTIEVLTDAPEQAAPAAADLAPVLEPSATPVLWDERALYVTPDASLAPFMQEAIDRLSRLGFNVAISDGGVPVFLSADMPAGNQGYSHGKNCFYDSCTASNSWIKIQPFMVNASHGLLINSIIHELGHVISGWGACTAGKNLPMADGMHLVKGNLVSNGNTGYANFVLTQDDLSLLESCLF